MFDLYCKGLQQDWTSKPLPYIKEIAVNFGMDKLVEPSTLVNILNAVRKNFVNWACKVNPKGD